MKSYTVSLKEEYAFLQGGDLDCLLMSSPFPNNDEWKRPAVIVVPGGGYREVCFPREGDPVSTAFMALGYQTFVLKYLCSMQGVHYPEQLLEIAASVDYIRKHAKELNVNEKEIFIVGFSAGGHLVANLSVAYSRIPELAGVNLDCKPTAVSLGYPVISHKYGPEIVFEYLLQGYSDVEKENLIKETNLDEYVSDKTPPTFVWTTAKDNIVPPENSIRYVTALNREGVDYEFHIYPLGEHGLSTGNEEICSYMKEIPNVSGWVKACADFFRMYSEQRF